MLWFKGSLSPKRSDWAGYVLQGWGKSLACEGLRPLPRAYYNNDNNKVQLVATGNNHILHT